MLHGRDLYTIKIIAAAAGPNCAATARAAAAEQSRFIAAKTPARPNCAATANAAATKQGHSIATKTQLQPSNAMLRFRQKNTAVANRCIHFVC